ncbi:Flagellar FliJ protein [compost metagenome]
MEAARRALLEAELRLASLRKVMEKRRHDLELAEMRRDQKQTDERAALQYRSAIQGSEGREY